MIEILKIALSYFAIVFAVGFLFGMLRVPFLVPAFGERIAEIIELPFMLAAIFLAARWIVRSYGLGSRVIAASATGFIAASILLLTEFSVVLWIRGLSIADFLESRDRVAAILYYLAVAIFAVTPAILAVVGRPQET